jgi:hypothetical protein
MQNELACNQICEDIASLLAQARGVSRLTAYHAASATRDVADALHHAAGKPDDQRWHDALSSLESFLTHCGRMLTLRATAARVRLRRFVEENADLLTHPMVQRAR